MGVSVDKILERTPVAEKQLHEYTAELVRNVEREKAYIDSVLERHLDHWSLSRLGSLERSIMRIAAFEILRDSAIPDAVAVTEAVELSKRYVSEEARMLVNGVLGAVVESQGQD